MAINLQAMFGLVCWLLTTTYGGSISRGASLSAAKNETLMSPNGTFVLGFTAAASGRNGYNLAIWYKSTSPKTIVWTAPNVLVVSDGTAASFAVVSANARVLLRQDGNLALEDESSEVWTSATVNENVTSAALLETGNLVLIKSTMGYAWESFNYPTDTLLPNQQLVGKLVSGQYSFQLSAKYPPALYYTYYIETIYWTWPTTRSSLTGRISFNSSGLLGVYDGMGNLLGGVYPIDFGSPSLRRITLDADGNLRMYSLSQNMTSWLVVWQAVLLECDIHGGCGAFGICIYAPRRTCTCPQGFHPIDPRSVSSGCTYNVPLPQCGSKDNTTKLITLARTDYWYDDYKIYYGNSQDECTSICLNDCKCLAAAYKLDGSGTCWLKGNSALYNGKHSAEVNLMFFLKVSSSDTSAISNSLSPFVTSLDTPLFAANTPRHITNIVDIILPAVAELFIFSIFAFGCWYRWSKKLQRFEDSSMEGGPSRFSYEQLEAATSNFSESLGKGGFGTVYKGMLPDKSSVAVKVLEAAKQGEKQFKAEVTTIGKIHHINLVRMLGYCAEGSHRMLVYEYMPNGSLDSILFSESVFDWATRFKIALGIAKGITYLHEECHGCILHCDIKPQNILLDESFCPKVADFGLAKMVTRELSITTIRGTRGYMAPEWVGNLPITSKADVYSFGMVLLEIISGRTNYILTPSALDSNSDRWAFPLWAFPKFVAGNLKDICDPKLGDNFNWDEVERMFKVAFWCIQKEANSRPSMGRVVQMLEDTTSIPELPLDLAF